MVPDYEVHPEPRAEKIVVRFLEETGCKDVIENGLHLFKPHDFGFRGVSSVESEAIGGSGYLVNLLGTDTIAALQCVKDFYHEPCRLRDPPLEHSTMTSGTRDGELNALKNC